MGINLILTLFLFASLNSFAEEFKVISLSDALSPGNTPQIKNDTLPLQFTVPNNFEKRYEPRQQTVIWGTSEDIDNALTSGRLNNSKNGLFTLKISLNVGFDEQTNKFTDEEQMKNGKGLPGVSDSTFRRTQINGFPMATFTGVVNNRHLFLHYIAIGNASLLINYFHPETFSARDIEIWSRFMNGLKMQ